MTARRGRLSNLALLIGVLLWIVSCQSRPFNPSTTGSASAPTPTPTPVVLNGTGATFPLFLYQQWFSEYNKLNPAVQVNYQATGSGVGIQQLISQTTDFGASDVAMTDAEMAQVESGVVLLPVTAGNVAIAYNLPGVETLRLSRAALAGIFLGTIDTWDDPLLAEANPDVALPALPIVVVYRSDGSGTTAVFTNHLSAISPDWRSQVGSGLNVSWVAGVGVKSNAGVSAQIQQQEGAIGYVEYGYAQKLGMTVAALENKAGQYVTPSPASTAAALQTVQFPADLRAFVPDPEGENSYPIVTYSWILAYRQYEDANKSKALRELLQWSLTDGQAFSEALGYVPLPAAVAEKALAATEAIRP